MASGEESKATTKGVESKATTNGVESKATSNGEESQATTKGVESQAITNGEESQATTNGEESQATTNGEESQATTNGVEYKGTTNESESKTSSGEEEPKVSSNKEEPKASITVDESKAITDEEAAKERIKEAARREFPLLHEMISRGVFLVYSRNCKSRHIIKTAQKVPLYTAKFLSTSKFFSFKFTDPKLVVWNADGEEILHLCQSVKELYYGVRSEQNMKVFAVPDIYLGYIDKKDEHIYNVYDASGTVILYIKKKDKNDFTDRRHKITTADHMRIGAVGNKRGNKFMLKVPVDMPIRHKALLFALTVSFQDYHDDGYDMPY